MRSHIFSIVAASIVLFSPIRAVATENGALAVYADQFQGRPTASGALYDVSKLSAAHASMPFGTVVRVANFETGRMVDVVVNDRKGADGRILTLSRSAAEVIQLPANRTAPGSMMILQSAMVPAVTAPGPATTHVPAAGTTAISGKSDPAARKFRPLGGLFAKDASPTVKSAGVAPVQYGIPAAQYAPQIARTAPATPALAMAGPGELMPMSAGSVASTPLSRQAPLNTGQVRSPGAAAVKGPFVSPETPYRVQFGAFRRVGNANELAVMLGGAGIPSAVIVSPGTSLNLVVTQGGFRTAEEAQRWIDFEGARRGWVERPVVIR